MYLAITIVFCGFLLLLLVVVIVVWGGECRDFLFVLSCFTSSSLSDAGTLKKAGFKRWYQSLGTWLPLAVERNSSSLVSHALRVTQTSQPHG